MAARVVEVEAPVREVTVFEDRAHVVRVMSAKLEPGLTRVVVRGVAPALADKTLGARLPAGGAKITELRAQRERVFVDEHKPEQLRELESRLEALDLERAVLSAERRRVETRRYELDRLAAQALSELADDAAWGRVPEARWNDELTRIGERQRDALSRLVDIRQEDEKLEERSADLKTRIMVARTPSTQLRATLVAELMLEKAGTLELWLDYVVPGACWRPYHTATLADDGALTFRADGCVWQNTGEDWSGVTLRFSTERPSLGLEPPLLKSDVVQAYRKGPQVTVAAREQVVHTAGLGRAAPTSDELPGIDDAGSALELVAKGKASVPSDGRPYRVELFRFETSAELDLVCTPELLPQVVLKSTQVNRSPQPLLAGPVDLIKDGGLCGRGSTLYVAAGERFELGWGPDTELTVHRERERLDSESRVLSAWTTTPYRVRNVLTNLGKSPKSLQLVERIVVSEIEKLAVEVDDKRTQPAAAPDKDGFLRWRVELGPHERARVQLGYVVKQHSDVAGLKL